MVEEGERRWERVPEMCFPYRFACAARLSRGRLFFSATFPRRIVFPRSGEHRLPLAAGLLRSGDVEQF